MRRFASPEIESPPVRHAALPSLLWVAWIGLLGGSFVVGSAPLRVGSSVALAAAAWVAAGARGSGGSGLLIAVGMTLGLLGDAWGLVRSDWLGVPHLIPAMILFGLGHVAYIAALIRLRRGTGTSPGLGIAVCGAWSALVLAAWHLAVNTTDALAVLRGSALAYSLLLGGTAAAGTLLAIEQPRYVPVAVGAALFLASDLVLAVESFRGSFPYATELCWGLYGPAQMLIVYGAALAARRSARRELVPSG